MTAAPERSSLASRLPDLVAALALIAVVLTVAPWKLIDVETYMRMALGRYTLSTGPFGQTDPFLFTFDRLPLRNPEWVSDVMLYGAHRLGGEPALVALKLTLLSLAWGLLYALCRVLGARAPTALGLAALSLATSVSRLRERPELNAFWLIPALGLVLEASRRQPRWLLAVPALGALWANCHGSFILAWAMVFAALADAVLGAAPDPVRAKRLAAVLVATVASAMLGPSGLRTYAFVYEHLKDASAIRGHISEWTSPDEARPDILMLPVHLLGIVGLASFLPQVNRRQVGALVCFLLGYSLARSSVRMTPMFGLLAMAPLAANLQRAADAANLPRRTRTILDAALLVCAAAMVVPAAERSSEYPYGRGSPQQPGAASQWIGAHVSAETRLFGPYMAQLLMWEAPRVKLYIHPHLTYSTTFLLRYFDVVIPSPEVFEREVARYDIDLALVCLIPGWNQLADHLDADPRWQLSYLDDHFALYARRSANNTDFLGRYAIRTVRARLDFEYLDTGAAVDPREHARLAREAPRMTEMLDAHLHLTAARRTHDPAEAATARAAIERAMVRLPGSPSFAADLAEARWRAGDRAGAEAVVRGALRVWPGAPALVRVADAMRGG